MAAGALMAIGTVLSGVGTLMQNQQQAADARKSAAWLHEQAEFARIAGEREEEIFGRQMEQLKANQKLSLAGSGVDLSGSVFEIEDQVNLNAIREIGAIRLQTAMNVREARLKAGQAQAAAELYSDPFYNLLSVGGPMLTGFASASKMGFGSGTTKPPTSLGGGVSGSSGSGGSSSYQSLPAPSSMPGRSRGYLGPMRFRGQMLNADTYLGRSV